VIVTFNSEDVLGDCLEAVAKMAPDTTIVVVDNASADSTLQKVRGKSEVLVIANSENRGFAAAANQGFRATGAELILLLNPDVRLQTPLDALTKACRKYGLAAGQLTDSSGSPQAGFTIRRFPSAAVLSFELLGLNRLLPQNPVNRRYRYLDRDLHQTGPVEQPAGAFLMTRRDVWERLGGFDEGFHPMWFEDVDFCRRAIQQGYRIEYVPQVHAEHVGGHSIRRVDPTRRELCWYASLLKYAEIHFGAVEYRCVCFAALLSSIPRMVAGMIQERSVRPVISCIKIIGLTVRRLSSPKSRERSKIQAHR
jgi:N-acetylglucosaminyl-diphospho-decaprenol L-rhamnosyltransferase